MTNTENIKNFVQKTLGCGCPEEVFQIIECKNNVLSGESFLRNKINIGNRLLIYVADIPETGSLKKTLPTLIHEGKEERDRTGFNRFRLVLAADNVDEIKKAAVDIFSKLDKDEKVHLHVISKDGIPIFLNT